MKTSLQREIPFFLLIAAPSLYLAAIWNEMPDIVPLHWNIEGEADSWGDKNTLWIVTFLLPLCIYGIFRIVPKIDPRRQIAKMGAKYRQLKFILVGFSSTIAVFIIYSSANPADNTMPLIFIITGVLFAAMGNYMQTIRPNYFIGIRTPWTLENESIWKKTHVLAGKLWFAGGILIALAALALNGQVYFILFMVLVAIMVAVPVVYSFLQYKLPKD